MLCLAEVEFWHTFISQRGGRWEREFNRRVNPDEPLETWVQGYLDPPAGTAIEILDVGAGPLTILGKVWNGRQIHITAVDPLAVEYTALLRREGIVPLVPILPAEAEQLVTQFGHERFDVVHCANALDHSHDPFRAILQMMSVVKTGGYVLLRHFRREAENRGFTGLHPMELRCSRRSIAIWERVGGYRPRRSASWLSGHRGAPAE